MSFRFHVLGLPHTSINPEYIHCAYSMKLRKYTQMMVPRGHEVILYSNEGADVPCENVQILSEGERAHFFGSHNRQKLYDLKWDSNEPYWRLFNERCIDKLRPRARKGDFILTASGNCARPIADALPNSYSGIPTETMFVEPFIGYYGTFSRYRVYESHSHREWCMGAAGIKGEDNDSAVIPNYWDLADFVAPADPGETWQKLQEWLKGRPYYLFIGRVIHEKGIDIAEEVTSEDLGVGMPLVIAGQGGVKAHAPDGVFLFGAANAGERAALMTNAVACLCPTRFREPFGGTAAESQLCGTPAITTDHGAFTETVDPRWRCASHREFIEAAQRAAVLSTVERLAIKLAAEWRWSLEAVAPQFERYFGRLFNMWEQGWYQR
jgi:glycosyltransferase involved in cell wall biosynthesis